MRVTVIVSLAVLGISDNAVGSDAEHADALVSWIRRENGFYNEKMKIRRANPNDLQSRFGIFATDKVNKLAAARAYTRDHVRASPYSHAPLSLPE